jgi:hypothetical protein
MITVSDKKQIAVIWIVLFYYVYEMARTRNRSVLFWIFYSLLLTPLLSIILLKCIGDTEERKKERILEEEELKEIVRLKYQETASERICNPSARTIGDRYKR